MTNKESAKKVISEFKKLTEKPCYEIEVIEGNPDILDDKLGGKPYLPEGEKYPTDQKEKNIQQMKKEINYHYFFKLI